MDQRQGKATDGPKTIVTVVEQGQWARILVEHNKETDAWAEKGARGLTDEWEDDSARRLV